MTAYKFLCAGRIGQFSGFAWPEDEWVEAEPNLCVTGIHGCAADDLPYWLSTELWEIELEDAMRESRKLVAPRGRLRRRIETWDSAARTAFAKACVERLRKLADAEPAVAEYLPDAERRAGLGDAVMCGFIGARAAEVAGGEAGYEAERARQATWLVERLGLDGAQTSERSRFSRYLWWRSSAR